jgi:hypothetical protein
VNGLTLLEAEFANHRYERHFHGELVLAITESGTARINCWGRWFTVGPGDIFVSNPNDPQAAMTFGAALEVPGLLLDSARAGPIGACPGSKIFSSA